MTLRTAFVGVLLVVGSVIFAQVPSAPRGLAVITGPPPASGAPGGFVELSSATNIRPVLTPAQIAVFMPAGRGKFTFPAPYNTEGYRLTIPADCANGSDCITDVGYSYWPNINNHAGSNTLYAFVVPSFDQGGAGPSIFSLDKTTGAVANLGPLFPPTGNDARSYQSGEGWYFSATNPTMLYMFVPGREAWARINILTKVMTTAFSLSSPAAVTVFGVGHSLWQVHSSADDKVHSFTVRGGSDHCGVYLEATQTFKDFPTPMNNFDECQVDRSGRWLVIKEQFDGLDANESRMVDLQTGAESILTDRQGGGGHSDMGYGYFAGGDNWYSYPAIRLWTFGLNPPGPGTVVYRQPDWATTSMGHVSHTNAVPGPAASQYMCGSDAERVNGPRSNEVACFPLDGSLRTLVVAPVMTNLDAPGGKADYTKDPKGNLDVTGQYFIWTSNLGGARLDAFIVRIPSQLLRP